MNAEADDTQSSPNRRRIKVAAFSVMFIAIVSVLVALVLVEIAVRLLHPEKLGKITWNDRPPNYYFQEASETERDYAYHKQKPAHTFRIGVIGDSFTYGQQLQLDDTFPKRLERLLNLNNDPRKVEVLNLSVSGYSSRDEIKLVREALEWQCDLIVLEITLNDPEIDRGHQKYFGGDAVVKGLAERHPIFHYWKTLDLVVERIENSLSHDKYVDFYNELFSNPESRAIFEDSIKHIKLIADTHNTPLVTMTFPLFSHPFDKRYPFHAIHRQIRHLLKSIDVPNLDLFSAYHGIPPERLQVEPGHDLHPNEIAHRIAAEQLYVFLKAQRAIPRWAIVRSFSKVRDVVGKRTEDYHAVLDIEPLDQIRPLPSASLSSSEARPR